MGKKLVDFTSKLKTSIFPQTNQQNTRGKILAKVMWNCYLKYIKNFVSKPEKEEIQKKKKWARGMNWQLTDGEMETVTKYMKDIHPHQ